MPETTHWSVRVRPTSGTGEVRILGYEEWLPARVDGSVIGPGRALACTHLFGSYSSATSVPFFPVDQIAESVLFLTSRPPIAGEVDNPAVYNTVLMVMDIEARGMQTLEIRTVVTKSASAWGRFESPCINPKSNWKGPNSLDYATHVRGHWPNANPRVLLPTDGNVTLVRNPTSLMIGEFSLFELDSGESQAFSSAANMVVAPDVSPEKGNPACYGANVIFQIPMVNNGQVDPNVARLHLVGRNAGDSFACANQIGVILNTGSSSLLHSVTRPVPGSQDKQNQLALYNERLVDLTHPSLGGPIIAPPSSSGHIDLFIAVAGGSATPVNLQYTAPYLGTAPNEGGNAD